MQIEQNQANDSPSAVTHTPAGFAAGKTVQQ